MKHNTAVEFAYHFLGKGIHLREVQRFVDASPSVDPTADTIPAPPPSDDGSVDFDTVPTPRLPPRPALPRDAAVTELLDLKRQPEVFWDEVAGLVECLP